MSAHPPRGLSDSLVRRLLLQVRTAQAMSSEAQASAQATGDALFDLVRSPILSNMTLHIKGWVGPVLKQQGVYPSYLHTGPWTPAEQQQEAGKRFNSELALFLLVAEEQHYWMYSWFWGFQSWVPDDPDSQIPHGFFPQAKCALGAPTGPPKKGADWTYTREFTSASVFVDLKNRTASKVTFKGAC